jgi:hypothetical protein
LELHDGTIDPEDRMDIQTALPGIEAARNVLGFTYEEVAAAVLTDPSTLYRWRQGHVPTAIFMSRLERIEDLTDEIQKTMRREMIGEWLNRPIPAFKGATARQMILNGRAETVLGALLSLNRG